MDDQHPRAHCILCSNGQGETLLLAAPNRDDCAVIVANLPGKGTQEEGISTESPDSQFALILGLRVTVPSLTSILYHYDSPDCHNTPTTTPAKEACVDCEWCYQDERSAEF